MNIAINGLTVTYRNEEGAVRVLDDITLALMPGRILALVGESGSGKTTLGKALMGLLPKKAKVSGRVTLGNDEITRLDEEALNPLRWSRIAMVFQNGRESLNPLFRIVDQVAEPLICAKGMKADTAKQKAEARLAAMGLTHEEIHRFPYELSGGQILRALLAMALVLDPGALILDEPTAALDAITKSFIAAIIKRARDEGKAVLLITHDLDLVHTLADEAAVLYFGRIMEMMPAVELLTNPLHPYTLGLCRSYPTMKATKDLGGIKGDAFSRSCTGSDINGPTSDHFVPQEPNREGSLLPSEGCLFSPRCTQATAACRTGTISLELVGGHRVRCVRGGVVPILELHQVSKDYDSTKALLPTDFRIRSGEVFCVVGETGSGKTTLAMIAAGFLKPDQGLRLFCGRNMDEWIRRDYPSLAGRIGVIYQNPAESVSHRLTLFDIVAEPLVIKGTIKDGEELRYLVYRALADVHLPSDEKFLNQYPHELNMGAIQRLCIARALVTNPDLLIADEPTSALDPSVQAKVMRLFLDLQIEKGLSLCFITHNMGLARKIADRIGVMLEGRFVEIGPACSLFSYPQHPYTRFLIERAGIGLGPSSMDQEMRLLAASHSVWGRRATIADQRCPFVERCNRRYELCMNARPEGISGGLDGHTVWCHYPQEDYRNNREKAG